MTDTSSPPRKNHEGSLRLTPLPRATSSVVYLAEASSGEGVRQGHFVRHHASPANSPANPRPLRQGHGASSAEFSTGSRLCLCSQDTRVDRLHWANYSLLSPRGKHELRSVHRLCLELARQTFCRWAPRHRVRCPYPCATHPWCDHYVERQTLSMRGPYKSCTSVPASAWNSPSSWPAARSRRGPHSLPFPFRRMPRVPLLYPPKQGPVLSGKTRSALHKAETVRDLPLARGPWTPRPTQRGEGRARVGPHSGPTLWRGHDVRISSMYRATGHG